MDSEWIKILAIIVSNLVIMLTIFRTSISLHNGMRTEMKDFHKVMHEESKDFHGRLIELEARRKFEGTQGGK